MLKRAQLVDWPMIYLCSCRLVVFFVSFSLHLLSLVSMPSLQHVTNSLLEKRRIHGHRCSLVGTHMRLTPSEWNPMCRFSWCDDYFRDLCNHLLHSSANARLWELSSCSRIERDLDHILYLDIILQCARIDDRNIHCFYFVNHCCCHLVVRHRSKEITDERKMKMSSNRTVTVGDATVDLYKND